ncbi:aminotransferase class I/II-fold pyridoxal phosphate-dependent enzyme [Streptomyces sp. NPDC053079]|uniref:aminotransferase class I/II-fold pyridoxal phosphate-dependent enzyme n=1 Tax=Streptomyces sp. NPDC053079 TaxID=3365697 RepID=UPI0037CE575C
MRAAQRLAVTAHRREIPAGDPRQLLDLRWSPDEAAFAADAMAAVLRDLCGHSASELAEAARHYAVRDPFAAHRAAPVLSAHLGCPLTAEQVTAGAGTTGLLQALAGLGRPGPVLHLAAFHPDLPLWARRLGATVAPCARTPEEAVRLTARHRPALVLIERPAVDGGFAAADVLGRLAGTAAGSGGGLVVVDESYATYGGPGVSLAPLVADHPNLVVLRGLSKGYCAGGLRVGFALAAPATTERLRELAPPLAVNEVGLSLALGLLARGDVFAPLRARIAAVRPRFISLLRDIGLVVREPDVPWLPWVVVPDGARARAALERRDVLAKEVCTVPPAPALLRLSVPLSEERECAVARALTADG